MDRARREIPRFIKPLVFLSGLLILCYPYLAGIMNRMHASGLMRNYNSTALAMDDGSTARMLSEAVRYNEALLEKPELFYTPEQLEGRRDLRPYREILDPGGNGIMGILKIPRLRLSLPIYHGTEGEVLNEAVGHMEGSSFPVGGAGTHAVLSAHRGLPEADLFTDLPELSPGDRFSITVLDRTLFYSVFDIRTVLPEETESLLAVPGKELVTLVTCTPYGINSHRLLVTGRRTEEVSGNADSGKEDGEGFRSAKEAAKTGKSGEILGSKIAEELLAERRKASARRLPVLAGILMTALFFRQMIDKTRGEDGAKDRNGLKDRGMESGPGTEQKQEKDPQQTADTDTEGREGAKT